MNEVRSARLVEVIEVTFNRGAGIQGDPVRRVTAYFDKDGTPLAERDPLAFATPVSDDTEGAG